MEKTLNLLHPNDEAQILDFSATLSPDYASRLRELGFREGEFIRCLRRPPMGAPLIYEVGGTIFSVENEVASKILLVSGK